MTDIEPGVPVDATTLHHALVGLHALAAEVETGTLPGFHPPTSTGDQLRAVAAAPEQEVPISARVDLLYRLTKKGSPGYEKHAEAYRALAGSVASARGLDAEQLLSDLKETAGDANVAFEATASGQALPHHEAAFVGSSDVCNTRTVTVGGLNAVWVFSEFETDAPFEQVAEWVDPHHWPERGPMLFKRMEPVGPGQPADIPGNLGTVHWQGVFREEVQLVSRLDTLLTCAFWRDGATSAGMTYDLHASIDGQIDVDRGFLLVNELGPVRRVKALKVVGFTTDIWDVVAGLVCPFWTDWVRGAVRGGTSSTARRPGNEPTGGPTSPGDDRLDPGELLETWVRFFGSAARDYLDLFTDVGTRMRADGYSTSDWLGDGTRYWAKLAQDWAKAWSYGLGAVDEVAREGPNAGLVPPGTPPASARGLLSGLTAAGPATTGAESTIIPVTGLARDDKPVVSPLVSIEAGGAVLAPADVTVTVVPLGGDAAGVRLATTAATPPGLYVGTVKDQSGQRRAPAQLYVSGATGSDPQ
jgi:hypothetical protein